MYMAPEQFQSGGKVCAATDLFSLGMMAYTLLVGAPYWREEKESQGNVYAFVAAVMSGPTEVATVRALRQGVDLPAAFDAWFVQATAKDPVERFGKATDAIFALTHVLGVTWSKDGSTGRTGVVEDAAPVANVGDDKARMVLAGKTPMTVEAPGQATGFGLSASQSGALRWVAGSCLSGPMRHRSSAMILASVVLVMAVSGIIVVGVFVGRMQSSTARASVPVASVVRMPVPSAESSTPPFTVEPRVDVVAPVVSASASTNPVETRLVTTPPPKQQAVPTSAPASRAKPRPTWGD
jgi:serine/threonine-protein kinase